VRTHSWLIQMISNTINKNGKVSTTQDFGLKRVYAVFVTVAVVVFYWVYQGEAHIFDALTAFLTLSAIFQCLAFCLLGVHMLSTGSVQGISAKSLQLEAIALACRLSSTTWLAGYVPNDASGDYLYQFFDVLSLAMVLWLLHRVLHVHSKTYEVDDDSLPVTPLALGSLVLAGLLHADVNDRPVFDTLWMCGLFVGALAVLPQLWLMTRNRVIPAMTSHFVAVMAFSRILSGLYMWRAHEEISCTPWIKGFNHSGHAVLAAHAVHLVLLGDFAYFYVKNLATRGLCSSLELPDSWIV